MSTYVIGDVHGCFEQFVSLLDKINYNSQEDKIILTGDLVNRGPESLAVLNYCMADRNITSVLGNHDLYLLYLMNINQGKGDLKTVVEAENNMQIFEWLITRPLLIEIPELNGRQFQEHQITELYFHEENQNIHILLKFQAFVD